MFKLFLYIALCVALVYYNFETAADPCLEKLGDGEYCVYSTQDLVSSVITKKIDLGFSYIYFCESKDAALLRGKFDSIDGESIVLSEYLSALQVLKKLGCRKVSESNDNSMNIIYGYSNKGKNYIKLGTRKINIQIAERAGRIVVGWPVILGSY